MAIALALGLASIMYNLPEGLDETMHWISISSSGHRLPVSPLKGWLPIKSQKKICMKKKGFILTPGYSSSL